MTRRLTENLFLVAALGFAVSMESACAQSTHVLGALVEGRNYYNGYGIFDYPPYARPLNNSYTGFGYAYGTTDFSYSGYGNGPYGAGGGSEHEFLSTNRYGADRPVYDGYGSIGRSTWDYPRSYTPYGYELPRWRRY